MTAEDEQLAAPIIQSALDAERRATWEEAFKADCFRCERGEPVRRDEWGDWMHPGNVVPIECLAAALRARAAGDGA